MSATARPIGTARARLTRALGAFAVLVGVPAVAHAQSQPPSMQLQTDADTVAPGDVVHVEMTAQSGDEAPADPRLTPTPGFVVVGQNASPTQTHILINGTRIDRYGLTVDWALQAQRLGTFTIGPPTIVVGGQRFAAARAITLRVVPAGKAPTRRSRPPAQGPTFGPFSPFDPWKNLFPGLDQDDSRDLEPPVTTDPSLALGAGRGAGYFLHATVDKKTAVVGEQVTFSIYEYLDRDEERLIDLDEADVHDATAADFAKRVLQPEDRQVPVVGYASIGGHVWRVALLRRWALFPLRAGDLAIGPMSVTVLRPRGQAGLRTTEVLHVHVSEPPLVRRPAGYALGDVGRFSISAQVAPRQIDQGGAVGVHVEVSGTGNIPSVIATPAREGAEWLAPEVHDQLGPAGHDQFGGKRTFDFVVRLERSGDVDLGELTLPFWDPERRSYETARAVLGVVHVAPPPSGASAEASDGASERLLPGLPAPRTALGGAAGEARRHLDDTAVFWVAGVGAWPLALVVAAGGRSSWRKLRASRRSRKRSPGAELRQRTAAAEGACAGSDSRLADAAIARALEAAALAHAGVGLRGALGDDVVERLADAGVERGDAAAIAALLRECEAARFSPVAGDVVASRARWLRAQAAIRALEKR